MTTSITTFLTYDTQAEEAAKLYTSLFGGKIKETMRYPGGGPKPGGPVLSVTFELFGQTYIALNGGPTVTFGAGFLPIGQGRPQGGIHPVWREPTAERRAEV